MLSRCQTTTAMHQNTNPAWRITRLNVVDVHCLSDRWPVWLRIHLIRELEEVQHTAPTLRHRFSALMFAVLGPHVVAAKNALVLHEPIRQCHAGHNAKIPVSHVPEDLLG